MDKGLFLKMVVVMTLAVITGLLLRGEGGAAHAASVVSFVAGSFIWGTD